MFIIYGRIAEEIERLDVFFHLNQGDLNFSQGN